MTAYEWFAVMMAVLVAGVILAVYELFTDPPAASLVPRCKRCDEMRSWGHVCEDAERQNVVDR